jgi:hypothetical protein
MPIEAGYMSWNKDLGNYLYTRFPTTQFIPLAVFLAAAGLAPSPPAQLWHWLLASALTLSLVLQFRLWDDIADRDHDRETHPDRILCHTNNIKPFLYSAAVLFVLNGLLIAWHHDDGRKTTVYLAICVCLLAWYRLRPYATRASLLNIQLILLKYPAIAWLISVPAADTDLALSLSCLLSVYLIFIIFEILDDNGLRKLPGAGFSLVANLFILLCVWVFIFFQGGPHSGPLPSIAWTGIITGTLALGLSGFSKLKQRSSTRSGHGFFVIGLLAYLAVAVENSI